MPVIFKDFVGKNMRFFVSFFRKLFVKMRVLFTDSNAPCPSRFCYQSNGFKILLNTFSNKTVLLMFDSRQ